MMCPPWRRSIAAAAVTGIVLTALGLACYRGHGLSPPEGTSGIRGNITFVGDWPDSTKEVRLVVLKNYPEGMTDPDSLVAFVILNLASMSDPIPMNVDAYAYQLELDPGTYAWVLVVWLPEDLFGIKELGAYYADPQNPVLPAPVTVTEGAMLENIDIIADFANILRDTPFF